MNKTLTVNIGGLVFHIDENAYHQLDQYLNNIKQSMSVEERDEIVHDIEIRIAELFSEQIDDNNQVITVANVEKVISIMGKPEDYVLEDDENFSQTKKVEYTTTQRKLYRDGEKAIVGGVLAGLGHYFKVDTLWMRILFLILVFFYGTGILLYLIMWIVIPKATTTSQILEMYGEPININTIEKKVRENINYVTDKINGIDYEKIKKQTRVAGENSAKLIRKFFGIFFIFIAVNSFISLVIASIFFFINKELIINEGFQNVFPLFTGNYSYETIVALGITMSLIPLIGFFLIGLKLLYPNLKYVFATCIGLFILWIISTILFSIPFMNFKNYKHQLNDYSVTDYIPKDSIVEIKNIDELKVAMVSEDFFNRSASDSLLSYQDFINIENLQKTPVEIEIQPTFQDDIYARIEISGALSTKYTISISGVKKQKLDFSHNFDDIHHKLTGDTLIISDQIINAEGKGESSNLDSKIKYYIYIPKGKKIILDQNIESVLSDDDFLQKGSHIYEMIDKNELVCTDC